MSGPRGEIAIDELEIFNRELIPTEICTIASAGSAGKCRNTVSALVSVNQPTFTVGQTLAATVGLANPGLLVMADFYLVRLSQNSRFSIFNGANRLCCFQ